MFLGVMLKRCALDSNANGGALLVECLGAVLPIANQFQDVSLVSSHVEGSEESRGAASLTATSLSLIEVPPATSIESTKVTKNLSKKMIQDLTD